MLKAQDYSKEAKKYIKEAEGYYKIDEYDAALPLFIKAEKLHPKDPQLSYKIGVCYLKSTHGIRTKALPHLIAAKEGGYASNDLNGLLGTAYHLSHKFKEAINALEAFKAGLGPKEKEIIPDIDKKIAECKTGIELIKNPVKVKIKNLGPKINSEYPDYVPAISADETTIIFTSRRDNTVGGQRHYLDNHYMEDIYMSVKSDSVWTSPVQLGSLINTSVHDACVGISPDGQEMFVYRDNKSNGGDLYLCKLIGNTWSEPVNMGPNINTSAWEPSATITADENTLFFTSTRKGGYGGADIYMSKKLPSGEFGPAILLGPKINTAYDEDAPFIHADGKTLYFSSKGHKTMGGFDIFSCTVNTETGEVLTDPVNVGYPINTADDDVFFFWTADNKRAYFSSVRDGGYGEKDLYMLERDVAEASLAVFKGSILACEGEKPVAATIIVTDNATQKTVGVYTSNSSTGKYTVILPAGKNYGIAVEAPGYLFYSKNIDIPNLKHYQEIKDQVCLEALKVGKKIVLRNVFFDFDAATLRNESQAELERLVKILTTNPDIKIQISGHTDSDGNDAYNLKLSERRAKAVTDYVIQKGIKKERLSSKGFGETVPVVPNDTPENRQLNRRTEIEIME